MIYKVVGKKYGEKTGREVGAGGVELSKGPSFELREF